MLDHLEQDRPCPRCRRQRQPLAVVELGRTPSSRARSTYSGTTSKRAHVEAALGQHLAVPAEAAAEVEHAPAGVLLRRSRRARSRPAPSGRRRGTRRACRAGRAEGRTCPRGQDTIARLLGWQEPFPTRAALALAAFVCVIARRAWWWLQIDANPKFSPIDEAAHFDYVERVSQGEIPRQGERLTESTLARARLPAERAAEPALPAVRRRPARVRPVLGDATVRGPAAAHLLRGDGADALGRAEAARDRQPAGRHPRDRASSGSSPGLLLLWAAARVMAVDPLPLGSSLLLARARAGRPVRHRDRQQRRDRGPGGGAWWRSPPRSPTGGRPAPTRVVLFAAASWRRPEDANMFAVVAGRRPVRGRAIADREPAEGWERPCGAGCATAARCSPAALLAARSGDRPPHARPDRPDRRADLRRAARHHPLARPGDPRGAELFKPLTGLAAAASSGSPRRRSTQNVQAPFYAVLSFLVIGAGLAGLFVSPRRWPNALGLIAVPALYVGGVVFGLRADDHLRHRPRPVGPLCPVARARC